MLNALRNSVGTIWAKLLLGLLVVAFAAWGLEGVFAERNQTVAAQVGEAEISVQDFAREFDGRLRSLRQSTGANLTPEEARRNQFDLVVLNGMATNTAINEEARAFGFDVSDDSVKDAITAFPAFQGSYQKFDRSLYDRYIQTNRLSARQFEETIRSDLKRDALLQTIGNGTTAPRALAEALYAYRNEKRAFEHISLSPADVESPGEPTEDELATFHEENAPRFTAPEYRQVSYVALTVADLAETIEISDEDLRAEYEDRILDYTTPERRTVENIVFDTEDEAREAADKIADGTSFAQLAEARGLTASDVALGTVTKSELSGALGDAAFAAEKEGITDPIGTALGWSLLNIKSIQPENVTSFDKAEEELRETLARRRARAMLPERSVDLDDQLAAGATLQEAATQTQARFAEVDALDTTGRDKNGERIADLPSDPEFLARVFSSAKGDDPVLIEGTTGDYFALRVEDVTEAALRPLDTIRDEVAGAWEAEQRESALETLASSLKQQLTDGDSLADIAEAQEKDVETAGPGTRTDRTLGLSADLVDALFEAEEGAAVEGAALNGLSRLVGTVSEIVPATSETDGEAIDRLTEGYAGRLAQDFVAAFSYSARQNHPLIPNQAAIDRVFSTTGGY